MLSGEGADVDKGIVQAWKERINKMCFVFKAKELFYKQLLSRSLIKKAKKVALVKSRMIELQFCFVEEWFEAIKTTY